MLQFINLTKPLNYKPKHLVTDLPYLNFLSASTVQLIRDWLKGSFRFVVSISKRKLNNKKARKLIICERADKKPKYIYKKMYNLEFLWFPLKLPVPQKIVCVMFYQ